MRSSFAARLAVAFAVVGLAAALVTVLLVNLAFGSRFSDYLEQQQDERHDQLIISLGEAYQHAGGWDGQELQRIADTALMDGGMVSIEAPAGTTVWEWEQDPMAELHRRMMGTGPLGDARRTPVEVGGDTVGVAVVQFQQPGVLPQDAEFRASVNRMLVLGTVAAAALALLLGTALARRATAPARALTETARSLAAGDRAARVPAQRHDEFGEMARAFNRMADTVAEEDRVRRDFAADVAHELRTPLMILRGEIEALQDGIAGPTPEALASLREETLRLGRLVDDLDTLARADAAGFNLDRRPTEITQVVAEAAAEFEPALADRSITLEPSSDRELTAVVDPVRVRQVVTNLLSNTAKFTPDGGRVRVAVERDGEQAVLTVWNSGPGIPAADLPQVFDRFYRGQQPHAGGTGIGLTVVRDLVDAHGGTVAATSSGEHGTTFRVRLPLRPSPGR